MPRQDTDASSEFRIFETEEFQKKLGKLPVRELRFIRQKLTDYVYPQLRIDPFLGQNIKKLKGYQPATWRYRIGKFRLFFLVDTKDRIVAMLSVDDRRDAYR
ncbi:MAG: type II toxin-antitoxin system RelE/ParE family toxin [Gammaproteobacteria bacterium]|nr:type II toxin-antitoxin system RelE/ParE family toxin [Gammaproteobacteria bacterium]